MVAVRHDHKLVKLQLQYLAEALALLPLEVAFQEHIVELQELGLQRHKPVGYHGAPLPPTSDPPRVTLDSPSTVPTTAINRSPPSPLSARRCRPGR